MRLRLLLTAGRVGEQIYPTPPLLVWWAGWSSAGQDFRARVQFVSEELASSHESEAIIAGPLSPVSSCPCSALLTPQFLGVLVLCGAF